VTISLPWILWPAPCAPALLAAGERTLDLLVLHGDGGDAELRAWADGLALRAVGRDERVPLAVASIDPAPSDLDARAADALALADVARLPRVRVRFRSERAIAPVAPARVACFDLVRGETVVRSRCVAFRTVDDRPLCIAFATDLHLAAMWDELADAIARHAPDLEKSYLDPRRHLAAAVAELDALAARGELDAVVLGGDLVDHVYRVPRCRISGASGESNVPQLVETLAPLRAPTFAIPGNHDFRLCPWRSRSYGLAEFGIPPSRAPALLRAAGLWGLLPWRLSDLDALRSREPGGRTALAQHLLALSPVTDQRVSLGALDLVLVSTGRDLPPRWRSIEPARRTRFLRALRTSWLYPDLEGLGEPQLDLITRSLAEAERGSRGIALFQHGPLLHPPERGRVEERLDRLDPGDDDRLPARVAFEHRLGASGLRRGVFFRNPAPLVRALRSSRAPAAVFMGHVHRAHAMTLERDDGALRSVAIGSAASDAERVALLSAPSLGQTDVLGEERPGYFVARFSAGRLTEVAVRDATR
jgi:hypothetical protein